MLCHMYGYLVTCTGDYHILLYLEHGRLYVWLLVLVTTIFCCILSMAGYMLGYLHWWLSHLLYLDYDYGRLHIWLLALVATTFCYILRMAGYMYGYVHYDFGFMDGLCCCLFTSRTVLERTTVKVDTVLTYCHASMNDNSLADYLPYFQVICVFSYTVSVKPVMDGVKLTGNSHYNNCSYIAVFI